jgi:hypothetical protein
MVETQEFKQDARGIISEGGRQPTISDVGGEVRDYPIKVLVAFICFDAVLRQSFKDFLFYYHLVSIATFTAHPEYFGIHLDTDSVLKEVSYE